MKHKLRYGILTIICSLLLCFGLINVTVGKSELSQTSQRHILDRLSFGVNSAQLKQAKKEGIEAYIQSQLNPESITESSELENYLAKPKFVSQQPIELQRNEFADSQKIKKQKLSVARQLEMEKARKEIHAKLREEAMDAHLARAIYSNRQLQEVMVDFWFNHFNVFAGKGTVALWVNDYENKLRTNAFGKFRDLLSVTATHPAMLIYLDNQRNRVSEASGTKKAVKNLNENYARELMELHTLGVDGGYTQEDVIELAKIFTGWSINVRGEDQQSFFFDEKRHDHSEKVFLGHKIEPNGIAEGQQALDILATHPATAKFISYKLAQYFVADEPPSSLVDKLAQKFLQSDGNIKVVMDTLIHAPELDDPQYYRQKFQTPFQYIVSLVRTGEIKQPNWKRIRGMLISLSMPTYMCVAPIGYKNTQDVWLNSQAILQRIGFATAIANGVLNREQPIQYKQLISNYDDLSDKTKQVISKTPRKLRSAIILGSPEAMYR